MESATTWLGISMVFLIAILLKRGISYAVIVGVTFATALSWFKVRLEQLCLPEMSKGLG
mgnify:CR=1 FL=1|jgi:hypothetical protein